VSDEKLLIVPERFRVREADLLIVSKRLLLVTLLVLGLTVALFGLTWFFGSRFPVSWFCFGAGVLGGFVSIQQRLKGVSDPELFHLAYSWVNVLFVPLFGGIFALVLYLLLLSGMLQGALFPAFSVPGFADPPTTDDLLSFFTETYPASGSDFAKLGFWAFAAGFSERLVPDMIKGVVGRSNETLETEEE
jgi:hypothetical protein